MLAWIAASLAASASMRACLAAVVGVGVGAAPWAAEIAMTAAGRTAAHRIIEWICFLVTLVPPDEHARSPLAYRAYLREAAALSKRRAYRESDGVLDQELSHGPAGAALLANPN
jgi:hypothetical protein